MSKTVIAVPVNAEDYRRYLTLTGHIRGHAANFLKEAFKTQLNNLEASKVTILSEISIANEKPSN